MAQFSLCIRTVYPEATSSKVKEKGSNQNPLDTSALRVAYAIAQTLPFGLKREIRQCLYFIMKVRILSVFYLQTKDNGMARRSVIYRAVITA